MSRISLSLVLTFSLLLGMTSVVHAEKYALLIGVGKYPLNQYGLNVPDLDGPAYDLVSMEQVLKDQLGFKTKNIIVLKDQAASKSAITTQLKNLSQRTKRGDFVMFYYSGHGTSAYDASFKDLLPYETGAMLPYDIQGIKADKNITKHLIIGKNDIRPHIERMDQKGVQGIAFVDACFSGDSFRDFGQKLPSRYVKLPTRSGEFDYLEDMQEPIEVKQKSKYPYKNFAFIAASSEREKATDFDRAHRALSHDKKPHGAFTDSLLRVFKGMVPVDTNHDSELSYSEIFQAVKRNMSNNASITHSPRMQPTIPQDKSNMYDRILFDASQTIAYTPQPESVSVQSSIQAPPNNIRVKLTGNTQYLLKHIQNINDLVIVSSGEDIKITSQAGYFHIKDAAGQSILQLQGKEKLVDALKQQMTIRNVERAYNRKQDFSIHLSSATPDQGETFVDGDVFAIKAVVSKSAYLMLFDLTTDGELAVISPYYKKEYVKLERYQQVGFASKVVKPYGKDRIIALATKSNRSLYDEVFTHRNSTIKPGEPLYKKLIAAITRDNSDMAVNVHSIYTMAKTNPLFAQ